MSFVDGVSRPVAGWLSSHTGLAVRTLVVCLLLALWEQGLGAAAADPWSMAASQLCTLFTGIVGRGLAVVAVIVGGLEEGLLPHFNAMGTPEGVEEERRLLYVGMTRARRQLFLTWSKRRTLYGRTRTRQISPFVAAIDPSLLEIIVSKSMNPKPQQEQLSMF